MKQKSKLPGTFHIKTKKNTLNHRTGTLIRKQKQETKKKNRKCIKHKNLFSEFSFYTK